MFDSISDKISSALRTISGRGKISEKNISEAVEQIKEALLDADVNLRVVRRFVNSTLDEALGEVIGYLPMSLDGERAHVRTRKTNLSKMICEAMTAESGADFSIINGGSIRASLKAGPFTAADILNVLPFANYIVTCETTPAGIYAMLEDGYAALPEEAGAFAQTDLKVVYSASAPQGEKVRRVYLDGVLLDPADDATVLTVATNDFIAAGGDSYGGLGSRLAEGRLISEVFQDHLEGLYPRR